MAFDIIIKLELPVIENRGFLSQDFNLHGWFAFNDAIPNPFTGRLGPLQ
jgi:hypothetical protein